MVPSPTLRTVNGAMILVAVGGRHGLSPRALLAGAGLTRADLDKSATVVTFEQEFRMIRNLLAHCGDPPGLGFEAGSRYRFTPLASVGFGIVSSRDLRGAIDIVLRYSDLNPTMVPFTLDASGPGLRLRFIEDRIPSDLRRFAVERSVAAAIQLSSEVIGRRVIPLAIEFTFDRPRGHGLYRRFAGVMPKFNSDRSLVVLKQRDAAFPLASGNPLALQLAEEACHRMLAEWKARTGFAAEVRERIAREPGRMLSMDEAAASLFMSGRTMRRRLAGEGTTYTVLCDEVREAMAERLLAMQRLPIEQVAERLGYSETSSFIHAFKRWKGQTPRSFRDALLRRKTSRS